MRAWRCRGHALAAAFLKVVREVGVASSSRGVRMPELSAVELLERLRAFELDFVIGWREPDSTGCRGDEDQGNRCEAGAVDQIRCDRSNRTNPASRDWPSTSGAYGMSGLKSVVAAIGISGLLAMPSNAQEIGHSGAGLAEARRLCSQCHAVEKAETPSPRTDAPAFQDIAGTSGMTATALSAALNTSHQSMPNIMLESDEKADIVAYILSLK